MIRKEDSNIRKKFGARKHVRKQSLIEDYYSNEKKLIDPYIIMNTYEYNPSFTEKGLNQEVIISPNYSPIKVKDIYEINMISEEYYKILDTTNNEIKKEK